MILDLENVSTPSHFSTDIAVIGGGAVGITMAVELSRGNQDVILLEAGGISLETQSQEILTNARSVGFKLEGLHSGRFRLLGGTTNFWGGQLVPFDPIVFEKRPWANCAGWPFAREVLDPFYQRAMILLGMEAAETTDAAVWARAKKSPPDFGEDLELFFTRWMKIPNLVRHFRADLRGQNFKTLVHANVIGFEPTEQGNRIASIHLRTFGGRRATITAKKTVLACGTIEAVRLLLLPFVTGQKTPWHNNPMLGRAYLDHLDYVAGEVVPRDRKAFDNIFEFFFFDGYKYYPRIKLTEKSQRANQLLGVAGAFPYITSYRKSAEDLKMFVRSILSGQVPSDFLKLPSHVLALWKVTIPLVYRYLKSNRTFHPTSAAVHLGVTVEQVPKRESDISLREERDALDMPMIDVNWAIDGSELETIAYFAELIRDALSKADLADVQLDAKLIARDPAFLEPGHDTNHQMGGARMGRDATDGVVDINLRVFGMEDLYVAGAAVMPSSGFANCTLTAIALALRLCNHLRELR